MPQSFFYSTYSFNSVHSTQPAPLTPMGVQLQSAAIYLCDGFHMSWSILWFFKSPHNLPWTHIYRPAIQGLLT